MRSPGRIWLPAAVAVFVAAVAGSRLYRESKRVDTRGAHAATVPPVASAPEPAAVARDVADAPTPVEQSGWLEPYYRAWANESADREASTRTVARVRRLVEAYRVESLDQRASCRGQLCRVELDFEGYRKARTVGRIPLEERADAVVASPQPRDGPGLTLVVYLPASG